MRTSPSQFQLLVEFMERHGDLSKCSEGLQAKTANVRLWAELQEILNSDSTGDSKRVEKWRKVWSDLKNNTKKKFAKLRRDAHHSSGGRTSSLKLTELEHRVLILIGSKPDKGNVDEAPDTDYDNPINNINMYVDPSPVVNERQQNFVPVMFKMSSTNNNPVIIRKHTVNPTEKHQLSNTPNRSHYLPKTNNETDRKLGKIQFLEDEFHIFGLYVANQLRMLSEEQSVIAREQIQTTLTQSRLQDIKTKQSSSSSQHTTVKTELDYEIKNEHLYETSAQNESIILSPNNSSAVESNWDVLKPGQIKKESSDDEDS